MGYDLTPAEQLAVDAQVADHPYLIPRATAGKISGPALAAKNMRILLKRAYPAIKFDVRSEMYANGSSVYVSYLGVPDAPDARDVEALCHRFEPGKFHGQDDSYETFREPEGIAFRRAFGSVKYVHAQLDSHPESMAKWEAAQLTKAAPRTTKRASSRL